MGLLVEQVRDIENETNFFNDSTHYSTSSTSFVTLKDFGNIVLTKAGLVAFKIDAHKGTSGANATLRLKVGDHYVWAHLETSGGTSGHHTAFCYLAAGTYDVLVEGRCLGGSSECSIDLFVCGFFPMTDMEGSALEDYSTEISLTPTSRATCLGVLKQTVVRVQVYAITAGEDTNFENPGDNLTNGVELAVDGTQITFATRNQDVGAPANGAHAEYFAVLIVGSAHTFTISKQDVNTVVYISIVFCPWLLMTTLHQPLTLDIPQGSTLYLMLEPLDGLTDPTKYAYIGKVRAFSFGDATDYYYSLSGTGIQIPTYTFEVVDGQTSLLYVKSSTNIGGCISHIAVDLR